MNVRQIHEVAPSWLIFRDGCPGGEAREQVGARVDRVIARSRAVDGDIALSRTRAAAALNRAAEGDGTHFLLDTVPCVSSAINAIYCCADLERAFHQLTGLSSTRER